MPRKQPPAPSLFGADDAPGDTLPATQSGGSVKVHAKKKAGASAVDSARTRMPVPQAEIKNAGVARIVLPTPAEQPFDYLIPVELAHVVKRGSRVQVSFGRRKQTMSGFVVELRADSPFPISKLKPLLACPDPEPLADEGMMRLTEWMAGYYACSWGEALEAVIPAVIRNRKIRRTIGILRLAHSPEQTVGQAAKLEGRAGESDASPLRKQARVLRTLLAFKEREFRASELAETLGFSESPIHTLIRDGWLRVERKPIEDSAPPAQQPETAPGDLTLEQEHALERITPLMDRDEYAAVLLRGVTGSGKTEVYIHALKHALDAGKSGIVLVPEIALTPQTVRRFAGRLAGITGVAVLHSQMTDSERRAEWRRIVAGEARVVIGPRSAVFAPVKDLGLIVVDEEHEPTYKQDSTPRYHARDVAVMRCFQQKAVCLLGSATPSLESGFNAHANRYKLIELEHRVLDRELPTVVVVDMSEECRTQRRFTYLSNPLMRAATDALAAGQQCVMFLNRRGYNTFYICEKCGVVEKCPNCDVPMSLHREYKGLVCHYCLATAPAPRVCRTCEAGHMAPRGMGTELLEEELAQRFPKARMARMDSDIMLTREDYEDVLGRFRDGEIDILVGTQMIAKGLDFPNVTVVGVIHADISLHLADFRAQERTFQLLTQVAGRAGRGEHAGMVFVQTFSPDHPCIRAAQSQDYWRFYDAELAQRKAAHYPPFTRLLNVTVEARDKAKGEALARIIRKELDDFAKLEPGHVVQLLGPAAAPFARIRGRYRFQVLVKARDHTAMGLIAQRVRRYAKGGDALRLTLDVDPYSLL